MFGDLFDSPWKILIVAVVIIVLFGSKKLPGAARSLGHSMRILKTEMQGLHEDEAESAPANPGTPEPAAQITAAPSVKVDEQAQIDALQQQVRDLQRAATMSASADTAAVPQHTQQPS